MSRHQNNGKCPKCAEIFEKYPGFNVSLRDWFEKRQAEYPEFHCSDAGRGRIDQEVYFKRGASRAHYGESSHNYGCGIDTFWLINDVYTLTLGLYLERIKPKIPEWLLWGYEWKTFRENPHFEIKAWKTLRDSGLVKLVE